MKVLAVVELSSMKGCKPRSPDGKLAHTTLEIQCACPTTVVPRVHLFPDTSYWRAKYSALEGQGILTDQRKKRFLQISSRIPSSSSALSEQLSRLRRSCIGERTGQCHCSGTQTVCRARVGTAPAEFNLKCPQGHHALECMYAAEARTPSSTSCAHRAQGCYTTFCHILCSNGAKKEVHNCLGGMAHVQVSLEFE